MPRSELENASVLVTGATGFLGGHLVRRLAGRCRRLVAMARGTASAAQPQLKNLDVVLGDVCVPVQIDAAVDGIDVVFHFAGHSGARSSADDPQYDLHANVGGIVSLLEAIRRRGRPCRVIFPGSRLEYGRVDKLPVAEDAPMRPISPYGAAKFACESYLEVYSQLYGISYAVARLTNPFGPWSVPPVREYNVLNKMIAAAQNDEELPVYGDGRQLRDYIYVDDVVDALLLLSARSENIVANVGSGRPVTFREAAQTIVRVVGRGVVTTVPWPRDVFALETGDFVPDLERMRALGWQARTGFAEGVGATAGKAHRAA